MAWADEASKTNQRHIVLVEANVGKSDLPFVNEGPGIWKARIFGEWKDEPYGYEEAFLVGLFEESGDADLMTPQFSYSVDVGEASEDGVALTERATYALMYANAGSYYWDRDEQEVYVHCVSSGFIHDHVVSVGIKFNLTNDSAANDLGEGFYDERLMSVGGLTKTKDNLSYGLIQNASGSIEINNHDGRFDWLAESDIFGQQLTIKYGFFGLAYADYINLTRTYTESAKFTTAKVQLQLRDDRQRLQRKFPLSVFSTGDYPNLSEEDVGKPIPWRYGELKRVRCICTNRTESSPTTFDYKLVDVADHPGGIIDVTKVIAGDQEIATANWTVDLLTGVLSITRNASRWGGDDFDPESEVYADIIGFGTRNLVLRGDCESESEPMIFNETTPENSNATWERSSAQAHEGTFSYLLTKTSSGGGGNARVALINNWSVTDDMHGFSPGDQITYTAWVYTDVATASNMYISIEEYYGASWNITTDAATTTGAWEKLSITLTINSGTTGILFGIKILSAEAAGKVCYVDEIQIEKAAAATDFILREQLQEPLDILEDVIETIAEITYNGTNFDTTAWEALKTHPLAQKVGIDISKATSVLDIIELVCRSIGGHFIRQDDGTYTIKITDAAAAISETITLDDYMGEADIDPDTDNLISVARVEFTYNQNRRDAALVVLDSERTYVFSKYGIDNEVELKTALTKNENATALGQHILSLFKDAFPIVSVPVWHNFMELDVMDVVQLAVKRDDGATIIPDIVGEVNRIKKDPVNGIVELEVRKLRTA